MHIPKNPVLCHIEDTTAQVAGRRKTITQEWPLYKMAEIWQEDRSMFIIIGFGMLVGISAFWWWPKIFS